MSANTRKFPATRIRLKRVYEAPAPDDGTRILVDRLWPRGVSKEEASLGHWMKDIAPSTELRQWFSHDPTRWDEFRRRYAGELKHNGEQVEELRQLARHGAITLLYAAHDEAHNHAVVLRDFLLGEA